MFDNIETLIELNKQKTMLKTALSLRISQSTVSKRINSLEVFYNKKLIEKKGRYVVLTDDGNALINNVLTHITGIREALGYSKDIKSEFIKIGISESILSSWGAKIIQNVIRQFDVKVEYHSHRSPVVIEKVESGLYDIGICAGRLNKGRSIVQEKILNEELVLLSHNPTLLNSKYPIEIITIESDSSTWKSIDLNTINKKLKPVYKLESFFSVAQLVMAGVGIGLVPIGVVNTLKISHKNIKHLEPRLYRPIQIIYKKSKLDKIIYNDLINEFKKIKL